MKLPVLQQKSIVKKEGAWTCSDPEDDVHSIPTPENEETSPITVLEASQDQQEIEGHSDD